MLANSLPTLDSAPPSLGSRLQALARAPGARRILFTITLLAGAAIMSLAAQPGFQPFQVPAERLPFVGCMYLALAGLAALQWRDTRAMGRLAWLPVACHLVVTLFAAVSFAQEGHWPFYAHPDPSALNLPWLYLLSVLAVPAALIALATHALAVVLQVLTDVGGHWRERAPALLHHAAIFAFSTWLWLFELSDRRLLAWLAD